MGGALFTRLPPMVKNEKIFFLSQFLEYDSYEYLHEFGCCAVDKVSLTWRTAGARCKDG